MLRTLGAPQRYSQGLNALDHLLQAIAVYGRCAVALADAVVTELLAERIIEHASATDIELNLLAFRGECTAAEIEHQIAAAQACSAEVMVTLGGGKTIDTAKGVVLALKLPLVIVSTIASSDTYHKRDNTSTFGTVLACNFSRHSGIDILPITKHGFGICSQHIGIHTTNASDAEHGETKYS